jgi:hypothetical protein
VERADAIGHFARRFPSKAALISVLAPKVSRPFEAALGLTAGRFDGSAANGFAATRAGPIIHPVLVLAGFAIEKFGAERAGFRRYDARLESIMDSYAWQP